MKIGFLLFVISLIVTATVCGQNKDLVEIDSLKKELTEANDTVRLEILDHLVGKYFNTNRYKEMYKSLAEVERLSHKLDSKPGLFKTYYHKGIIKFHIECQIATPINYLKKSLEVGLKNNIDDPPVYSAIYNNLGLVYKNAGKYDSAMYYYNKAADINERHRLDKKNISLFLNMSRISSLLGSNQLALKYAYECLETAKRIKDDQALCTAYHALAEAFSYNVAHDLAKEYAEKALNLSIEIYGISHSNTAYILGFLSQRYRSLGDNTKALHYSKKSCYYFEQIYGPEHPKLAKWFIFLADNYYTNQQYDSAKHYYLRALKSNENTQEENNSMRVASRMRLGEYYRAKGDISSAIKHLRLALRYKTVDDSQKAGILRLLGDTYFKAGDTFKSLDLYQQSIDALADRSSSEKYLDSVSRLVKNPSAVLHMQGIAAVYEEIHRQEPHKLSYLSSAMEYYAACDTIISNCRNIIITDEDKLIYNNSGIKAYNGGVRVAHQLYEILDKHQYIDQAFLFAERSKSNLLYQTVWQQNALQQALLPDSILGYGEELKGKINFYMSQVSKNSNGSNAQTNYEDLLFDAKRKYEDYLQHLESEYPRYYQLKYSHDFLTLQEVQKKLKEKVLIEYVLTEESIYIFLVTSQDAKIVLVKKPAEFEDWISEFRSAILSKDYRSYQHVAHELYKLVFKPVEKYLKQEDQIVVVPDGNLWYLNFDLLLREKDSRKPFQDLAYLIRDYTISYANSANHFFINDDVAGKDDAPGRCLAFSYSSDAATRINSSIDFSVLRNLDDDLPGTRKEIRSISKLMPGKYYFGPLASESTFKDESKKYSILHLALHGEIDNKNPMYSKLHFSKDAKDTLNDGYLNTYEIYNMSLNSQMAVLSACNTGYGKLEKGEGLMSLGRAFQYAGVNSLLLTSWEVADEEAPEIMYNFYKYLREGMGKSEALRQAKLEYLENAGMFKSAPFYWGSFVVIGDTSSMEIEEEGFGYWIYLMAAIPLIFVGLMVYNRIR